MSAQRVAVLLLWLNCCGSAVWRYSCKTPKFLMAGKRTTIKLEYEGASFSKWSVPETCSVKNESSPQTEVNCLPGFQLIQPILKAPDVDAGRYLFIADSNQCFFWYHKVINDFNSSTQVVFIWIYDPEKADPDELQRTANEPSPYSKVLTNEFASYGQKPTIYTIKKRRTYSPDEDINNGMWSITIPMTSDDELKEIKGHPVDFFDCIIANSIFYLTVPFLTIPETSGFLPISSPHGSQLMVDWEDCATSNIVVVSDLETFQSNDSFQTWTRIRVPPYFLTDDERSSVDDVSFSREGIFFLIKGNLYVRRKRGFTRLGKSSNLPDEIIGITTRKWCWDKYLLKTKDKRSYIAVWTRDALYLGYEHLRFNKILQTNNLREYLYNSSDTLNLHSVEYTAHPLELALLVELCVNCSVSKAIFLIIINEDTEEILLKDFKIKMKPDNVFSMHFAFWGTPALILSDKKKIYYSYSDFTEKGLLQIPTMRNNIHQIFIDYLGNIIVKMNNNIMYFVKYNIKEILKLHLWTNSTTKSVIAMFPDGQVYFIHVSKLGNIYTQIYPLDLEVDNIAFRKRAACPYIGLYHDIVENTYYLDKGQNLSFSVQLVYPMSIGMHIIMDTYGPNIIGKKVKNTYESVAQRSIKTKEIDIFQSGKFNQVKDYFKLQYSKTGIVLFSFMPSDIANTCTSPQKVFQVAIGCDPTKYIIVKGFEKKDCAPYEFEYDIESSYLRHQPAQKQRVKYDWKLYGCPLKVDIREKFHPLVQLYNEEGYVEDIDVNFIVWEIHGRKDYTFNTTMAQTGCLKEAQTWKKMTELNKSLPLSDAWGPQNYRDCFSVSGKPSDLSQTYEIINRTNKNHLVWPMDHTGLYVFRVKILDPNYSFCNLTALFAVQTFGLVPSPTAYQIAAVVLPFFLLYLAALFWSYIYFMNNIYQPDTNDPVPNSTNKEKKN